MNDVDKIGVARAASGPSKPAFEVKTAMVDFLRDLKNFKSDMDTRMNSQSAQIDAISRKFAQSARPALSHASETAPLHQKAFAAYVRSGDDNMLRNTEVEIKGVTTVANNDGLLVDPATSDRISSVLEGASSLRSIANVVTVEATAYDVLVDHSDSGAEWQDETSVTGETTAPLVDRITIPLHELAAAPRASQRLLDDAAFDVEGWLAERIADKFARAESNAFVLGNDPTRPKGFLTHNKVDNDAWSWGALGVVRTGADGDFSAIDPADSIVDLVYSLGARYRSNANFVMNSKTAGAVRKMKDADGRFLWSEGLAEGQPARLMGYPVTIVEDMPDIGAANKHAIAFGDFKAGYTIAERPELRILRDPYSARPHVAFYATKRVGGDVTDFAAIKLLRFTEN